MCVAIGVSIIIDTGVDVGMGVEASIEVKGGVIMIVGIGVSNGFRK
jgi:hypothetical protein